MEQINIYTDGGARGNPGKAAIGVYIEDQRGKNLAKIGKRIGKTTNNFAEYSAVLAGLSWILQNKKNLVNVLKINFFMDSELIVRQLSGVYKVKNSVLRELIFEIRKKEAEIKLPIFYSHITRDKNAKADKLVNFALDFKI